MCLGWRYPAFQATGPRQADLDAIWLDVPVVILIAPPAP
jgi:hypothetical protein